MQKRQVKMLSAMFVLVMLALLAMPATAMDDHAHGREEQRIDQGADKEDHDPHGEHRDTVPRLGHAPQHIDDHGRNHAADTLYEAQFALVAHQPQDEDGGSRHEETLYESLERGQSDHLVPEPVDNECFPERKRVSKCVSKCKRIDKRVLECKRINECILERKCLNERIVKRK